jgi:hypothetical protein
MPLWQKFLFFVALVIVWHKIWSPPLPYHYWRDKWARWTKR